MIRKRVTVHGRVQGVFFRQECLRLARAHGVGGWVRNRTDGSVEAVFEGGRENVEAMVAWARHGPPSAEVELVETVEEPVEGMAGFEVRYER